LPKEEEVCDAKKRDIKFQLKSIGIKGIKQNENPVFNWPEEKQEEFIKNLANYGESFP
jgi:hypothetical protein